MHKLLIIFFLISFTASFAQDSDSAIRIMHTGWENGRVPEFKNAFTLSKNEFRLNILGRSSFAFTDRFEVSSYLLMFILPNISFKYKYLDRGPFASSVEIGLSGGLFPIALVTGILLPGVAVAGGTIGFLKGSDVYYKTYLSYRLNPKLCFSVNGSVSYFRYGYVGLVGAAGLGRDNIITVVIPVNPNGTATWLMAGFEADYIINQHNVIVFNTSYGGFKNNSDRFMFPKLGWTHAKIHFHYTLGIYSLLDPPSWKIDSESKFPMGAYANIYWIFNNGR